MTLVPFCQADEIGDRFLALLSRLDIKPPSHSPVESELLSLTELIAVMRDPNLASGSSQAEVLRRAAGLHDFAAKVLSAEGLPEFASFEPHLKLLGDSADSFSTLIQNARAILPNDANRKLTELCIANLAIQGTIASIRANHHVPKETVNKILTHHPIGGYFQIFIPFRVSLTPNSSCNNAPMTNKHPFHYFPASHGPAFWNTSLFGSIAAGR